MAGPRQGLRWIWWGSWNGSRRRRWGCERRRLVLVVVLVLDREEFGHQPTARTKRRERFYETTIRPCASARRFDAFQAGQQVFRGPPPEGRSGGLWKG